MQISLEDIKIYDREFIKERLPQLKVRTAFETNKKYWEEWEKRKNVALQAGKFEKWYAFLMASKNLKVEFKVMHHILKIGIMRLLLNFTITGVVKPKRFVQLVSFS